MSVCANGDAAKVRVVIVDHPRVTARSMIEQYEANVYELWLQYFANGGNASSLEFEACLYGVNEPSTLDLDLLGFAIEDPHAARTPTEPDY